MEGDERTGTTRKNACDRETMVKIRLAIIFVIAQVVLTKHTSRRSISIVVEDRAIRVPPIVSMPTFPPHRELLRGNGPEMKRKLCEVSSGNRTTSDPS